MSEGTNEWSTQSNGLIRQYHEPFKAHDVLVPHRAHAAFVPFSVYGAKSPIGPAVPRAP